MDHFTTEERVMISEVPTLGVTTIYSIVGDLFAWICVLALVFIIWFAARPARA